MAVWIARAGKHGEQEDYVLSNGCLAVEWDDVPDLKSFSNKEDLATALQEIYPDISEKKLSNWKNQLWNFSRSLRIADLAVLPRKRTSTVASGRVNGPYHFSGNAPSGCKHQVPVTWSNKDTARQKIDTDLKYSLGSSLTVFQVTRNNAEQRLRTIFGDSSSEIKIEHADGLDVENDTSFDLAQLASDQISDRIGQRFKGHDLEKLVEEILKAQGFTTDRTGVGADGGVDILCGTGPLGLDRPRLCVQVKSQDTPVDVKVIRELQGVLRSFNADMGLVVGWGGFTSSADRAARQNFFEIRLWTSEDLIDQIQKNYDKISPDIQKDLPLKRVWTLVPD